MAFCARPSWLAAPRTRPSDPVSLARATPKSCSPRVSASCSVCTSCNNVALPARLVLFLKPLQSGGPTCLLISCSSVLRVGRCENSPTGERSDGIPDPEGKGISVGFTPAPPVLVDPSPQLNGRVSRETYNHSSCLVLLDLCMQWTQVISSEGEGQGCHSIRQVPHPEHRNPRLL